MPRVVTHEEAYDYVVVGAGSAGCVVARRLVDRHDCRVLLLEAGGPDDGAYIHDTEVRSMTTMWGDPSVVWPHITAPQPGLNGRTVPIPQGRVLGGGSSVNAMMYVRGNRRDFDRWRGLGNPGWGYADVLPYFRRAEDFIDGASEYRGVDGPVTVVHHAHPSAAARAFVSAAAVGFGDTGDTGEVGGAGAFDYNGERQERGAFFYQSTRTKDDRRCSTAVAYLGPVAGHPNLTVSTGAQATRVLFEAGRAVGVEYIAGATAGRARAESEVILTCGALTTPQLLMLSGVGPAGHLRQHSIPTVVDLRGVGQNLQDHLMFGIGYENLAEQAAPALFAEAGLFLYTQPAPECDSPDLQYYVGALGHLEDRYKAGGPALGFSAVLAQPASRGSVSLLSGKPTDLPVVDPRYLDSEVDVEVLLHSIDLTRELAHARAFDGIRGRELAPGGDITERGALMDYVRDSASTAWQPVGTCRMGDGRDAVVDARLRVHGVERLRVADASVMPTITCGDTGAATIMIAEKAADMIGADAR